MTAMTAMTEGYEALRHQATCATGDGMLSAPPRGLALLLRSGVGAWMAVWRHLVGEPLAESSESSAPAEPAVAERAESRVTALRLGPELAVLLVEMALSGHGAEGRSAS